MFGRKQRTNNYLGPLLRLEGLDFDILPPFGASKDRVQQFMTALLDESLELIGSVDAYYVGDRRRGDPSGWRPKGSQTYKGVDKIGGAGKVTVDLLERGILKSDLEEAVRPRYPDPENAPENAYPERVHASTIAARRNINKSPTSETWACRRSIHDNANTPGTGSWDEFSVCMKDFHVETELNMTPTVPHAQAILNWPAARLVNQIDATGFVNDGPGPWAGFTLNMVEMEHDLKTPLLNHRVFPVLQMTCRTANEAEFPQILVVSVPINGWKDAGLPEGSAAKLADARKIVLGSYTSVERFRVQPKIVDNRSESAKTVSIFSRVMGSIRHPRRRSAVSLSASAASQNRSAQENGIYPAQAGPSGPLAEAPGPSGSGSAAIAPANAEEPAQSGVGEDVRPASNATAADGVADQAEPNGNNEAGGAENEDVNNQETQIEWTMATASHARGVLPLIVQTPVVPKKIAIDVPLFLKFLQQRRRVAAQQVPPVAAAGSHEAEEGPGAAARSG